MNREEILHYFLQNYPDPGAAWRASVNMRGSESPMFPPQPLADVEHNLWARYYGSQGLPQAIAGLGGPFVYSGLKGARQVAEGLGLMEPNPMSSVPTITQLRQGQQGANQAFVDQMRRLFQ